ncbi:MAG: hypothetical protein N3D73_02105 [Candidatus Diapherotrites archaeon]|nr:hypothetical protein [Candidatus Diapherotrites archaeon]
MLNKCAIVCSEVDKASMIVRKKLIENFDFKETEEIFDNNIVFKNNQFKLFTIKENLVFADIVNNLNEDMIIFASKHSSKNGPKTLTVHAPGNWGKANFGGKNRTLSKTSASIIRNYIRNLNQKADKNECEVVIEQTHHGPTVDKCSVFIELGSREEHYGDEKAANIIAETIIEKTIIEKEIKAAIGIGGMHYNKEFTKLMLRTNFALGHMCPEYSLNELDFEMLAQAYEKTVEKVEAIVVDYKAIGCGEKKQSIKKLIDDFAKDKNLEVYRVRKILDELKTK